MNFTESSFMDACICAVIMTKQRVQKKIMKKEEIDFYLKSFTSNVSRETGD